VCKFCRVIRLWSRSQLATMRYAGWNEQNRKQITHRYSNDENNGSDIAVIYGCCFNVRINQCICVCNQLTFSNKVTRWHYSTCDTAKALATRRQRPVRKRVLILRPSWNLQGLRYRLDRRPNALVIERLGSTLAVSG
jgi:hypothetical protein